MRVFIKIYVNGGRLGFSNGFWNWDATVFVN